MSLLPLAGSRQESMDSKSGIGLSQQAKPALPRLGGSDGGREDVVFRGLQEIENKSRLRLRKSSLKEANESGLEQ